MKTIYLVRHAKSSWKEPLPDDQRPLLEKGIKRTRKVIIELHRRHVNVDHILSSHAVRALDTAKILAHVLKYPLENIRIEKELYHSNGDGLLTRLYHLPEEYRSVMIVGHNPALTDLANMFLKEKIDNLPTSGVVSISFMTDSWESIPLVERKVNFMLFPKQMKS